MSRILLQAGALLAALSTLVVGCGSSSDDAEAQSPSPPAETAPRPERPPAHSFAPPSDTAPPAPAPPSEAELSQARRARYVESIRAIDGILARNCGACHSKSVPTAPCGLRFDDTDDLDVLRLVLPLSAETSPVVQVIADGSMPPPDVQPRPTPSELEQLRAFIDDPASWSQPPLDGGRDLARAYADAESNACDVAPPSGLDAGAADAGSAAP